MLLHRQQQQQQQQQQPGASEAAVAAATAGLPGLKLDGAADAEVQQQLLLLAKLLNVDGSRR
jgi:hypothetical protein